MRLFGLIGNPLGHSFSKEYFTAKFLQEGISDCRYELYPIRSVTELQSLINQNPGLEGINVTIPYKRAVLSQLDDTSRIPEGLHACNCIRILGHTTIGYNTDIIGFEKSFSQNLKFNHKQALILGNGGAAEAVKWVLQKLGIYYRVVSRRIHDDSHLTYDDLRPELLKDFQVIINSTPLGTYPGIHECPPIPYEAITPDHYVYDLVYNPPKSLFLQKAETQGALIQNGYEMLIIQAEESWKIWNGG